MSRLVGIIGGMGPLATAAFMRRIVELTDATCDQDHVRSIVVNATDTPDRSRCLMQLAQLTQRIEPYTSGDSSLLQEKAGWSPHVNATHASPLQALIAAAATLEAAGCELLAIPCNTAHYYAKSLRNVCGLRLISMVDAAAAHCLKHEFQHVAVLGTPATTALGLYGNACKTRGIAPAEVPASLQADVANMIAAIKSGTHRPAAFSRLVFEAADWAGNAGVDAVILGCTELSAAFHELPRNGMGVPPVYTVFPVPVLDAMDALAMEVIVQAGCRLKRFQASSCNSSKHYTAEHCTSGRSCIERYVPEQNTGEHIPDLSRPVYREVETCAAL